MTMNNRTTLNKSFISPDKRAKNLVWTAAQDYDFEPEFLAFRQDGTPDFYMNSIIGYAQKWYHSVAFDEFLRSLKGTLHSETYDGLLWFALENCTFQREVIHRPLLKDLRIEYAHSFFEQETSRSRQQWMAQNSLIYALQTARCREILGKDPGLIHPREKKLYQALTFSGSITDLELIEQLTSVFKTYFHYTGQPDKLTCLYHLWKIFYRFSIRFLPTRMIHNDSLLIGQKSEPTSENRRIGKAGINLPNSPAALQENRNYIESCFGKSLYSTVEEQQLNQLLCTGAHKNCRIYFTDGERQPYTQKDPAILQIIKDARKQQKKNEQYFHERKHLYQNMIQKLTAQIRNAILIAPLPLPVRNRSGKLATSELWRALYLNDNRIFWESYEEEYPDFSVDLLLDASASCLDYQEVIAAQAYVLARSLQLCKIPVQVSSFCSLRGHTILHRFISYHDTDKNETIFQYFAAGWNRDGLALRGIRQLMNDSPCKNRLLIILTDASPNDEQKIPADPEHGILFAKDYAEKTGVEDTASEVRDLKKSDVKVMAILNSTYGNCEGAQKIYGKDFSRIEKPDQLSSAAGMLIQKQIQMLS